MLHLLNLASASDYRSSQNNAFHNIEEAANKIYLSKVDEDSKLGLLSDAYSQHWVAMGHVSLSSSELLDYRQSIMLQHHLFDAWIYCYFSQHYDLLQRTDTDITHWMVRLLKDIIRMAESPTVFDCIQLRASVYLIPVTSNECISFPAAGSRAYKTIPPSHQMRENVYVYF